MTRFRHLAAVLVGCLVLTAATLAAAADPAQGRAAFAEGQKLFQAGKYGEALAWFKKGYVATDDAAFLLNMAQCHRSLGEPKEALMMYRLYLKSSPEGANPEARAVATKAIRELESETAASPSAAPPAPTSAPAAAATVPAGSAAAPTPVGAPRNAAQDAGGFPVLEPIPDSSIQKLPEVLPTSPDKAASTARRLRLAGIVCGAAGLVPLGVGVYYWSRASSLSDSANQATVFHQAAYDQGKRAETMQWIFYSIGAAAVVTGAGLYVYGRWSPAAKKASVSLAPIVGPGGVGLQAHGAF